MRGVSDNTLASTDFEFDFDDFFVHYTMCILHLDWIYDVTSSSRWVAIPRQPGTISICTAIEPFYAAMRWLLSCYPITPPTA